MLFFPTILRGKENYPNYLSKVNPSFLLFFNLIFFLFSGLLKISLNPSAGKIEDVVDISPLGQNFASLHEFMNLVAIFGNQKIPVAFFNDNLLKVIVPRQPEDYTEVEVHLAIDGVTISEPATFEYDYTSFIISFCFETKKT